MIHLSLQFFGGRGSTASRNSGVSNKLPAKETFPLFNSAKEAYDYAEEAFYEELSTGSAEIGIFKTGSIKQNNQKFVVGVIDERKKLPKGYRWTLMEM